MLDQENILSLFSTDLKTDDFFKPYESKDFYFKYKKIKTELLIEQTTYEPTPLSYIFEFLTTLSPQKDEIVYDLGSGFGRVVLIGAIYSQATFKGIEIVSSRVKSAQKIKEKLNIKNAYFEENNVLKADFMDGDIFFLFNPFSEKTLNEVGRKLELISKIKPIKIATWGGNSNHYFEKCQWLEKMNINFDQTKLDYFRSIS